MFFMILIWIFIDVSTNSSTFGNLAQIHHEFHQPKNTNSGHIVNKIENNQSQNHGAGLSTDCPDFSVPLDMTSFTVAMAADDEQLNAVPLDCLVQLEVNIFYLYDDI
jgi:hypothetical protein